MKAPTTYLARPTLSLPARRPHLPLNRVGWALTANTPLGEAAIRLKQTHHIPPTAYQACNGRTPAGFTHR